jgi:hypothetical protein
MQEAMPPHRRNQGRQLRNVTMFRTDPFAATTFDARPSFALAPDAYSSSKPVKKVRYSLDITNVELRASGKSLPD